jgi:hypothetical protein
MEESKPKAYPVNQIKAFFNKNHSSIPKQPFWIKEHLRYNDMFNTIKTYIEILQSPDMDAMIKESAFNKLKELKDFIVEYQASPSKYNELNETLNKKSFGNKIVNGR